MSTDWPDLNGLLEEIGELRAELTGLLKELSELRRRYLAQTIELEQANSEVEKLKKRCSS